LEYLVFGKMVRVSQSRRCMLTDTSNRNTSTN
jgi:hypothetical protein